MTIFPYLRHGQWAAKIEIRDAYFHLGLHSDLSKLVRLRVGDTLWKFVGACFGLNVLPQKFMAFMRTFEKLWRGQGIQVFVYLDDNLLIGNSQRQVKHHFEYTGSYIVSSRFQNKRPKIATYPLPKSASLGVRFGFRPRKNGYPPNQTAHGTKRTRKIIGFQKSHVSKNGGHIRHCTKFFNRPTLLKSIYRRMLGWEGKATLPPSIKDQLKEVGSIVTHWRARTFSKTCRQLCTQTVRTSRGQP